MIDTLRANQLVHGELAKRGEYDNSPHFLPENKLSVKAIFHEFIDAVGIKQDVLFRNCLDLGCGTGFMYEILSDLGNIQYTGIDITDEMLNVFNKKWPEAYALNAQAEKLPFPISSFSLVVNYSFIDHLDSPRDVFKEAYRVLEEKGIFYSGLIPNSEFSLNIAKSIEKCCAESYIGFKVNSIMNKEYRSMFDNGNIYATQYGIDSSILKTAEPQKTSLHGLNISQIQEDLESVGFKKVYVFPNWFMAQALVKSDPIKLDIIKDYLRSLGPIGQSLFKYFDIFAVK